jgi:hypothetical protein
MRRRIGIMMETERVLTRGQTVKAGAWAAGEGEYYNRLLWRPETG